ncbi:MAG: hypothetical protein F6K18_27065 [Okeania sp. SIO2C2]|uniref:hypothetical protein n=1 Tax=Okeania sp. SIO2C2 TaxID=2607787 RepID=UPI0013BE50E2|nr:hypothetical protein [Okeania sp. SIO2C2]NEP90189.1 hypothetical protein [Okeania sp. SIO2C2]
MTETRKIKRTIVISLVLISSISLTACTSHKHREIYKSLEDCRREWGGVEKCELITDGSYPPGYYYGPYYYRSRSSGRYFYRNSSGSYQPVPNNAGILKSPSGRSTTSVGTVNRGGFGSRGGRGSSSFGGRGGGKG